MVVRVAGPKSRRQEPKVCAQDFQDSILEQAVVAHCFGRTCGKERPSATKRKNTLDDHQITKVSQLIGCRSCKSHPVFQHTTQLVSERLPVENRKGPAWRKGEAMRPCRVH